MAKRHVDLLRERFGEEVLRSLQKRWSKALLDADRTKLDFFVQRAEPSPCISGCAQVAEPLQAEEVMQDLLAKMVLCAPTTWFQVVTGHPCPGDAANQDMGIAFDASSRVRRAGVEFYHRRLFQQNQSKEQGLLYIGSLNPTVEVLHFDGTGLTEKQQASNAIRIVGISDTHLLHENLHIPDGDVLIHGGDLSYEESRSKDARDFEQKLEEFGSDFPAMLRWFKSSQLDFKSAISWLGTVSNFRHRILVGGNHDFILERLGRERAHKLCNYFGVRYLHSTDEPLHLTFDNGRTLRCWGSALSFSGAIGKNRAVQSGNLAFQLDHQQEAQFLQETAALRPGSVDVLVLHGPPSGVLLGKEALPRWGNDLLQRVRPKLFLCGHAHNPPAERLNLRKKVAEVEGVLGVHMACSNEWNSFSGFPVVVDLPAPAATVEPTIAANVMKFVNSCWDFACFRGFFT